MRRNLILKSTLFTALSYLTGSVPVGAETKTSHEPTLVNDQAAVERLRGSDTLSLQWLSYYNERGSLNVQQTGKTIFLTGTQKQSGGKGMLQIDGIVLAVFTDSFIFKGKISITNTPDLDRNCIRDGVVEFKITQNRKYWRMQDMERCDYLTDYVDIYF